MQLNLVLSQTIERVAFFASGQGTNFEALVEACQQGSLSFEPTLLVCSHGKAGALKRAERLGIPSCVLHPKDYETLEAWDQAVVDCLREANVDFIVLAGFTRKLGPGVLSAYQGRIVNIHPSLLPKYGGQGMYGRFVHEAVLAAGDRETGISVHVVTSDYDEGPVLAQRRIPVKAGDDAQALADRVREHEHSFYIEVLKALADQAGQAKG